MSSNKNTPQESGAAAVAPQPTMEDFPPLEAKDPKNYLQGT